MGVGSVFWCSPALLVAAIVPRQRVKFCVVFRLRELDLAFDTLNSIPKIPAGIYCGHLKHHALWESPRQDPRYNELLTELAPKN